MDTGFWSLAIASLLVLLSWIGLGWGLHKLLHAHRCIRTDWSLLAASGMSIVIAIGGLTNLFRLTSPRAVNAMTALGATLTFVAGITRIIHPRKTSRKPIPISILWLLPPIALAGGIFLSSLASTRINPGDDQLAYMLFPPQMLQSGTLLAPFNMRRFGTYGGQQFIQAQLLAATQFLSGQAGQALFATHGNILDTGLCALISAGLLWGLMCPRSWKQHLLASLLVLIFLLVPIPRVNTHAQMSGTLFLLALFRVLRYLRTQNRSFVAVALLAGLLGAALATLRMNFLPAAAIAIFFSYMRTIRQKGGEARDPRNLVRSFLHASLALTLMLAALIPWAIVLLHSSGTPFYPLMKGFQQGPFLETSMSFPAHLQWTFATVLFPPILALLAPLALAPWSRRLRSALPLYAAAIATTLATAWSYTQVDATTIYRYCSPLLIPCAFAAMAMILSRWKTAVAPVRRGALLLLFAIPCIIEHPFSEVFRASYPVLLGPILLFALWTPLRKSNRTTLVMMIVISLLLLHGAIHNFARMADNSGLFFYCAAIAGLAAFSWYSRNRVLQYLATITTAAFFVAGLVAVTRIFGPMLVFSIAFILLAACLLTWMTRRKLSPLQSLVAFILVISALFLAVANLPFILDNFSTSLVVASIGSLSWLAWCVRSTTLRIAVIYAITLLAISTRTSSLLYPVSLPIAWTTVVAALLSIRLSPRHWLRWTPSLLLLGLFFLAVEEARSFTTFHSPNLSQLAEQNYADLSRAYQQAQQSIPPGAAIFTLVTNPACLDFTRNPINEADFDLQFVSPPPKIPLHGPAPLLRNYWQFLGIRYVILSDITLINGNSLPIDFQNTLSQLAHTSRVLFNAQHLTVLDLQQ